MKLTDLQRGLLEAAAAHPDGLVLPPADMAPAIRTMTARRLSAAGLAGAAPLHEADPAAWHKDGTGLRITLAGREALKPDAAPEAPAAQEGAKPARRRKAAEAAPPDQEGAPAAPEAPPDAAPAIGRPAGKPIITGKAMMEAAAKGTLPAPPDFSAETHKRFRKRLAELVALVEAGDLEGLRAAVINPISSSPKALDRYRNAAMAALEAQAAAAKA
ncbi:hypothetical protein [Neoroseomonas soli]|uniref:Uncharacterized protein n=1 Tax=Neoroseomonas soli TaxID=1081025 RepID=A0A9X9WVK1_9PROT|nr:hypothetical protein [Neoroseomonas soli]MBR0671180.1 hypothetical protein [Neoroseomonas soli]